MSEKTSPQWLPEPDPQNELERLLIRSVDDPSTHGNIFRLLWKSDLLTFIPDHAKMPDQLHLDKGDRIVFSRIKDKDRYYVPILTSLQLARYVSQRLQNPKPAIVSILGEDLFRVLNDGKTMVRLQGPKGTFIDMEPDAVASMVDGEFRHYRPSTTPFKRMMVFPVPAAKVPSKLRDAVRVFCTKRRVPLGVYTFNPADKATGGPSENNLLIILWLREDNSEFYNDFVLMVTQLAPKWLRVSTSIITPSDAEGMAYVQTCTPLWPIVKEE